MKKKIALIALAVMLLSSIGYGTYAYTTVNGKAENVITTSGVHIELVETREDGSQFPEDGVSGIMPGAEESKIVKVANTGPQPAWIRAAVDVEVILSDGSKDDGWKEYFSTIQSPNSDWVLDEDGYFYYTKILEPGQSTSDLIRSVLFHEKMGNKYQSSTFKVKVLAMATQSANNGETVFEAAGWPETK